MLQDEVAQTATQPNAPLHATQVTPANARVYANSLDLAEETLPGEWLADWARAEGQSLRRAVLVCCAPPLQGEDTPGLVVEENLLRIAAGAGIVRLVYVSSTGVYPPGDGSWVDENVPVAPASTRGRRRLAAETRVLQGAASCGMEAVSLRAAGIYGPGRGVPTRLWAGNYRIIGDGDTYVSRIHVDDLVAAIVAAATAETLGHNIYNAADDEPETSRVYADAAAAILGVAPAPSVPLSAVDPWVATMMRANRRIANGRLKRDLGVKLSYPTWREGLAQIMAEDRIGPSTGEARASEADEPESR